MHMTRTTLNLDDDLICQIREIADREKRTLTQQISIVLRAGLDSVAKNERQRLQYRPGGNLSGLRAGIDLEDKARVRELMDEYDDRDRH